MNTKSKLIDSMLVLLATIGSAQPAVAAYPAQSPNSMAQEGKLVPVEGTAPLLVAGVQFNEEVLTTSEPSCEWYRIPSWFAGTWHRESVTTVSEYDYQRCTEIISKRLETAKSDDEEGWQKDIRGEYWNYDHTPFRSESAGDHYRQIFLVTTMKPLEIKEDRVVKRFEGTGVVIDTATGMIKHSSRAISIQTYRSIKPGLMMASSVTTEFDANGNPTNASRTSTTYRKMAEFHTHDFHSGKDLRMSFTNFLSSHGKSDLLPIELSSLPLSVVSTAGR